MSMILPIHSSREKIIAALEKNRCLILCAPPGTGKSTQVPKFLLSDGTVGRILVLQPRRIAARNLAIRVSEELNEPIGETVGYQVRFEGKSQASTRILFQTYGVFFQQLQSDPLLTGIGAVLLDEFHERTLDADASLAWLKLLRSHARPDLKLIVMSATLELSGLQSFLPMASLIEVAAETFPVEITHQTPINQEALSNQVLRALKKMINQGLSGSVLIFMPGQGEIRRAMETLDPLCREHQLKLFELHGSMDVEAQQRTLRAPQNGNCVILSTNVAETSLTIPGVTLVIDSGLARTAAYNSQRDMNTLYLGSISLQSARQRAGRAGRTAPGTCIRLWSSEKEKVMPLALDPEALRVEPTSLVLALATLLSRYRQTYDGKNFSLPNEPQLVAWLTAPSQALWNRSVTSLLRIGALLQSNIESSSTPASVASKLAPERTFLQITELGKKLSQIPAHPVLAKVLLDASERGLGEIGSAMIAIVEAPSRKGSKDHGASADLFIQAEDLVSQPQGNHFDREVRESYQQLRRLVSKHKPVAPATMTMSVALQSPSTARSLATHCWLIPFQDRIAVRLEKTQTFLLADGRKGVVEAGQISPEVKIILALELHETGGANQNRQVGIPVLLPCDSTWIAEAFPAECVWTKVGGWDSTKGRVIQEEQKLFRGLVLERRTLREGEFDSQASEKLLVEKIMNGEILLPGYNDEAKQIVLRIHLVREHFPEYGFPKLDEEDWQLLYHDLCHNCDSLKDLEKKSVTQALEEYLGAALTSFLNKAAPTTLKLPGVRLGKITYFENSPPELAARLGDFLGLTGKTTVFEGKVAVLYDILAPNYRTVQKTADLDSFWKNTYPEVKSELKRRYPKHPWP